MEPPKFTPPQVSQRNLLIVLMASLLLLVYVIYSKTNYGQIFHGPTTSELRSTTTTPRPVRNYPLAYLSKPIPWPSEQPKDTNTTNWQTYENWHYDFAFKYPPGTLVRADANAIQIIPIGLRQIMDKKDAPFLGGLSINIYDLYASENERITNLDKACQTPSEKFFTSIDGVPMISFLDPPYFQPRSLNYCFVYRGHVYKINYDIFKMAKPFAKEYQTILSTFRFTNSFSESDRSSWKKIYDPVYGFTYETPQVRGDANQHLYISVSTWPGTIEREHGRVTITFGDKAATWRRLSDERSDACDAVSFAQELLNNFYVIATFSTHHESDCIISSFSPTEEAIIKQVLLSFTIFEPQTKGWKTYYNETRNFTFKYPPNFSVIRDGQDSLALLSPYDSVALTAKPFIVGEREDAVYFAMNFTPFTSDRFSYFYGVEAGNSTFIYDRVTNQWLIDEENNGSQGVPKGKPTCVSNMLIGPAHITAYIVGDGRTNHPSKLAILTKKGILSNEYFSPLGDDLHAEDIFNTLMFTGPIENTAATCP